MYNNKQEGEFMKKGKKNICPRCKSEIPEGMAFCQFCMEILEKNGPVEIESRYKPKVNKWFAAIVITALCVLLVMLAVIIFMLSGNNKKTDEQSFSEISTTEQVTTVQTTTADTTSTELILTTSGTSTATKEIINTTALKTTVIVPDTEEILTEMAVPEETDIAPDTEEVFTDDTTISEPAVTEPVTEEMPVIQVPQADFETMIRNGFDSWIGLGDAETLSFDGYSCTFSDTLMGEHINCTLTSTDDFRSYMLTMSGNEYSTGSFVYGIDEPIRAFSEIVLGYRPPFMGGNIRGSIREMLSNNETSCHIDDEVVVYDIEYDKSSQTVTVNAYMN